MSLFRDPADLDEGEKEAQLTRLIVQAEMNADTLCDVVRLHDIHLALRRGKRSRAEVELSQEDLELLKRTKFDEGDEPTPTNAGEESEKELSRVRTALAAARREMEVEGTPIPDEVIAEASALGVLTLDLMPSTGWYMHHCDVLIEELKRLGGGITYAKREMTLMTLGTHDRPTVNAWCEWLERIDPRNELAASKLLSSILITMRELRNVLATLNALGTKRRMNALASTVFPVRKGDSPKTLRVIVDDCIYMFINMMRNLNLADAMERAVVDAALLVKYVTRYLRDVKTFVREESQKDERVFLDVPRYNAKEAKRLARLKSIEERESRYRIEDERGSPTRRA